MGKKIAIVVVALVVIIAGIVFIPAVVNKCDNCGETIMGTGYYSLGEDYQAIIADVLDDGKLATESADTNSTVCEDCINELSETVENYSLGIIDIDIEALKRPLFD